MNSRKNILIISAQDFFSIRRKHLYGDSFMFIESVLKYLERNSIPYAHNFDVLHVYTQDYFEAQEICLHFGINKIKYLPGKAPDGKSNDEPQIHLPIENSFTGNFTRSQPTLGLFGVLESATQGSFLKQ